MTEKQKEERQKRILDNERNYVQPSKEDCIMAVQEWKRKTSGAEYLWIIYQLNIRLGQMIAKRPKKYSSSYGEILTKNAMAALQYAQLSNEIFLSPKTTNEQFNKREEYLLKAKSILSNIMSSSYIFFELNKSVDGISEEQTYKDEGEIAIFVNCANKVISSIMKSDKERFNKFQKEKED